MALRSWRTEPCRRLKPWTITPDTHRWFQGAAFLIRQPSEWPATIATHEPNHDDPEVVQSSFILVNQKNECNFFEVAMERISSFTRRQRVIAWGLRFVHNCRVKRFNRPKLTGLLTVAELNSAVSWLVKTVQKRDFSDDIDSLRKPGAVSSRSHHLKLSPFLGSDGIVRVGGRLERSTLTFEAKHPIVLASNQRLSAIIIWHFHHIAGSSMDCHSTNERVRVDLRSPFWILRCRKTISTVLSKCLVCKRLRAQPMTPLIAPLPAHRFDPAKRPFVNTGVDFMGPLTVTVGRRSEKRWICLFTCLITRAVHLEIAHRLDTDSFLMCFQRFLDRRTRPSTMFSDHGTNFVASERELREAVIQLNQAEISAYATNRKIEWRFSPPSGPHFGVTWERMVQSCKSALKTILRNRSVTDEVLGTVVVDVEALLNSRPLTHVSIDPNDPEPLTPNHFLLGCAHPYVPLTYVNEAEVVSRRRFRTTQAILSMFWRRWLTEYVPNLVERSKWTKEQKNVAVGDIVLSIDPYTPRGQWPLARVVRVMSGPDNIVRVVRIKTATSEYNRPVAKLCLLESNEDVFLGEENRAGYVDHQKPSADQGIKFPSS